MSASFDCNGKGTLSDYNIQKLDTVQMLGRLRGGAEAAAEDVPMEEGEFNIGDVSDGDLIAELVNRKLGLKVLQEYPWTETLATIPDASDPKAAYHTNRV